MTGDYGSRERVEWHVLRAAGTFDVVQAKSAWYDHGALIIADPDEDDDSAAMQPYAIYAPGEWRKVEQAP